MATKMPHSPYMYIMIVDNVITRCDWFLCDKFHPYCWKMEWNIYYAFLCDFSSAWYWTTAFKQFLLWWSATAAIGSISGGHFASLQFLYCLLLDNTWYTCTCTSVVAEIIFIQRIFTKFHEKVTFQGILVSEKCIDYSSRYTFQWYLNQNQTLVC